MLHKVLIDSKIILLNYKIIICRILKLIAKTSKFLQHFSSCLKFLHLQLYFDGSTKLLSDLYLVKFLNIWAKSFFSCIYSVFTKCRSTQCKPFSGIVRWHDVPLHISLYYNFDITMQHSPLALICNDDTMIWYANWYATFAFKRRIFIY